MPCATAHAYAEAALQTGEDPVAAAMKRWRSGWYNDRFIEGEEDEPEHRLALGAELDLERLAELAIAIWQPLLGARGGGQLMTELTASLDAQPFDLNGPLPTGVTVLEASAGTGKTYTIAALAARFIAEGAASLDQLLLVTFTRVATSELRERVRERLGADRGAARPRRRRRACRPTSTR